MVDGQRRIISTPPLIVPIEELLPGVESDAIYDLIRGVLRGYRESVPASMHALLDQFRSCRWRARWSASAAWARGPGSSCSGPRSDDPLFLQAKEAQPSVLERSRQERATPTRGPGWWRASA